MSNLKSIFDSCEEQVENRLNGEGEREKGSGFVLQVSISGTYRT